jgi:hypothetical protein
MMLMMTMTATTIFVGRMMAENKVMDKVHGGVDGFLAE